MLRAHLHYSDSRVSLHGDADCARVRQARSGAQRCVFLEPETLGAELERFIHGEYGFRLREAADDMWLDVDFRDAEFERALVDYILRLIGARCAPLRNPPIEQHCQTRRA
jgi:hypothetical protein